MKKIGNFQSKWGDLQRKMGPQIEKLSKGFKKFGAIAGLALLKLIEASPRLRAQFEILNLRINSLVRIFGDELAPVIGLVGDAVEGLTEWFKGLPGPIQEAIKFGFLVIAVLGLLAIAFIALNFAMSPITLIILGIAAAAALLYLAWETNFLGIQEITAEVFVALQPVFESLGGLLATLATAATNLLDTFGPVLEVMEDLFVAHLTPLKDLFVDLIAVINDFVVFIDAIFKGDFTAAFTALVNIIKTSVDSMIDYWLLIPTQFLATLDVLGVDLEELLTNIVTGLITPFTDLIGPAGDAATDIVDSIITPFIDLIDLAGTAGADIATAFIDGIIGGIEDGVELVEDALELVSDLLGGSLPERGPLKDVVHMGEEVGETYVASIGVGLEKGGGGDTFNRIFKIDKVEMIVPESTLETQTTFMKKMDRGIRKATRF